MRVTGIDGDFQVELDSDDLQEMRDAMEGVIDWIPTDEQLRTVARDRDLLGSAITWSWTDTEVRADLEQALNETPSA